MRLHEGIPDAALEEGIASAYEDDRYLVLTRTDYERETIAYSGLRYTEDELDAMTAQPDVHHVQSNGEFDLYYVNGTAEPEE